MISKILVTVSLVLALLVQVLAGSTGPDAALCICTVEVVTDQPGSACCLEADREDGHIASAMRPTCNGCHVIPLPDALATSLTSIPTTYSAVDLPVSSSPIAFIFWPPVAVSTIPRFPDRPSSGPGLGELRTVILNC